MKHTVKRLLVAVTMIAAACAGLLASVTFASATVISLTNGDFETGTLTGWTTLGSVVATPSTSVTTFDSTIWNISAAGTTMAQLDSSGASISDIEAALSLASGSLDALNTNPDGGSLMNGAAIYQSFSGVIGDTVGMSWDYVARDYIPFNDPSFGILINPDGSAVIDVLASIQGLGIAVGTSGHSGFQTFSKTLTQTGTYSIAFVTTNDKDSTLNSALFLDNVAGTCIPNCPPPISPVPEPGSLALLALGLVGLVAWRRKHAA